VEKSHLALVAPTTVIGTVGDRRRPPHRKRNAESLIPMLSCKRCSPHPPFAKLIGLAAQLGALVQPPAK